MLVEQGEITIQQLKLLFANISNLLQQKPLLCLKFFKTLLHLPRKIMRNDEIFIQIFLNILGRFSFRKFLFQLGQISIP
jgi:hypothetical protein